MEPEPPTIVVFRAFKGKNGGQVIALFPELVGNDWRTCSSYMHIGQHGPADPYWSLRSRTRPATSDEIAPLARELESLGYVLKVRKRVTVAMHEARKRADREIKYTQ